MSHQLIPLRHIAACLLAAGCLPLLASTNILPPLPPANGTNYTLAAERRARIEAWRAERGGTNRTAIATPPENTRHLPAAARRAHLRAKLDELRAKKLAGQLTTSEQRQLRQLEALPPGDLTSTNTSAVTNTPPPVAEKRQP